MLNGIVGVVIPGRDTFSQASNLWEKKKKTKEKIKQWRNYQTQHKTKPDRDVL